MATPINLTFRKNLAAAIDRHPGTFVTLCNRTGYSTSYVRRVLNGERVNPTLFFVECIAGALDVDPLELLGATSEQA